MIILLSILTLSCMAGMIYFSYRAYILAGLLADSEEYHESVELSNMYMYSKIVEAYDKMQEIDRIGAFENDDESGTTFSMLKQVIDNLKGEFDGEAQEEK